MKLRYIALLAMIAILITAVSHLTAPAVTAQTGPNLLTNPGFEEGHYNQDGIPQLTVPNGWRLHYLDNEAFGGSNGVAYRPETVVWNMVDAPPEEHSIFWRDGIYTLKIFKEWAPLYAAISQDVTGLEVGRRYQFAVPVFIDLVTDYDENGKVPPTKMDSGMVRLGASPVGATWRDGNAINYSGWWTAETISPFYLHMPVFIHEFTATHDTMTVWAEVASRDPYPNNGFFLDGLSLRAMAGTAPPPAAPPPPAGDGTQQPPPPAAPLPPAPTIEPRADGSVVHTVQAGDTLWGLAIRYASQFDITAEQMLEQINNLNNSPAFLTVGQDLLIMPAGTMSAAAEEEELVDEEADDLEAPDEAEEEEAAEEEAEVEPLATENNAICIVAFHDQNANGEQDADDPVLADAALTLTRDGSTVATAVSDGNESGHCFEGLVEGTYTVQFFPPAGYVPTTAPSWAVAVADGSRVAVRFGAQRETAVAAIDTTAEAPAEIEADTPPVEAAVVADDSRGLMANLGIIIIAIAVFLIVLAGAGIFLLRRG